MKEQRNTKQKQLIYDCIKENYTHPTADEIYFDVHGKDSKVSRGTVYRNLGALVEKGELMQVKVPGADRYDIRNDNHYHIICTRCGCVRDVSIPYDISYDTFAESETEFSGISHQTFFEGICPECKNK